jgi:hypothetical protein
MSWWDRCRMYRWTKLQCISASQTAGVRPRCLWVSDKKDRSGYASLQTHCHTINTGHSHRIYSSIHFRTSTEREMMTERYDEKKIGCMRSAASSAHSQLATAGCGSSGALLFHPHWFHCPMIWQREQIMELLITQVASACFASFDVRNCRNQRLARFISVALNAVCQSDAFETSQGLSARCIQGAPRRAHAHSRDTRGSDLSWVISCSEWRSWVITGKDLQQY